MKKAVVAVAVVACMTFTVPAVAFGAADAPAFGRGDAGQKLADAVEAFAAAVQPVSTEASTAMAYSGAAAGVGFVDENGNGICDRYEQGTCDVPDCPGHGAGYGCYGTGAGNGSGYGNGYGAGGGSGYGNGYGAGAHHGAGHHGGYCR